MSTEVLEASPNSGGRNDPFSSQTTNIFLSSGRIGGTTSCGLSPPILSVVVENEHVGSLSAETLPSPGGADSGGSALAGRKRHHSSAKTVGNIGKRRRKTYERNGSKPKFLLGGTISDPLNLNSLDDEEISKIANAATPACSPLPPVNKDPDPVIVPQDFSDPLKLNIADDGENNSPLTKTLVQHVQGRKSSGKKKKLNINNSEVKPENADSVGNYKAEESPSLRPLRLDLQSYKISSKNAKLANKIVSPVLPDSRNRKRKPSRSEPSSRLAKALLIDDLRPLVKILRTEEPEVKKQQGPRKSPDIVKLKRQHSHDTKQQSKQNKPKFRDQDKKFQYGNYARYYGYRNPDSEDGRIDLMKRGWFEGKKCLDIGCNSGHVTLAIAKLYNPKSIVGMDIDGHLIGVARKNVKHCMEDQFREKKGQDKAQFPISMQKMYGPLAMSTDADPKQRGKPSTTAFPANVLFRCANFVLENNALLDTQREEYDTILCLSVTKWVHLNWGDAGIKRFFQRIFRALNPGGRFILEPQAWPSYHRKRKMTETTFRNYEQIRFKPNHFKDYLLSHDVGFATCEVIGTPLNKSKGFRRPILMFTKLQAGASRPVSRLPSPARPARPARPSSSKTPGSHRPGSSTTSSGSSESSRRRDDRSKDPLGKETSGKNVRFSAKRGADSFQLEDREAAVSKRAKVTLLMASTTSSKAETKSKTETSGQESEKQGSIHEKTGQESRDRSVQEKIDDVVTVATGEGRERTQDDGRVAKKRKRVEEKQTGGEKEDDAVTVATSETKDAGPRERRQERTGEKDEGTITTATHGTKRTTFEGVAKTEQEMEQTDHKEEARKDEMTTKEDCEIAVTTTEVSKRAVTMTETEGRAESKVTEGEEEKVDAGLAGTAGDVEGDPGGDSQRKGELPEDQR